MKTVQINLYSFDELSNEAKKKAIEKYYDINTSHEWHDLTLDEMKEELKLKGFIDPEIYFSGFSSQGDGACFICKSIDFKIFNDGRFKDVDVSANITHSWRYYFATSTTVNLDAEEVTDEQYKEIEDTISQVREDVGNGFYKRLNDEYDYLTSDEAIIETFEANEYTFEEDGTMNNG